MRSARFQAKIVFVTGGASGLGEASARRFATEGARLLIADINEEAARSVAESLSEAIARNAGISGPDIASIALGE